MEQKDLAKLKEEKARGDRLEQELEEVKVELAKSKDAEALMKKAEKAKKEAQVLLAQANKQGSVALKKSQQLTKETLKNETLVAVMVPKDKDNPKQKYLWVCVNGVDYKVEMGKMVEVPETVAKIVMESQDQTMKANEKINYLETHLD